MFMNSYASNLFNIVETVSMSFIFSNYKMHYEIHLQHINNNLSKAWFKKMSRDTKTANNDIVNRF